MKKSRQLDLEDYLAKKPQRELPDAFTGELFQPRARNHYEDNDGVPVAPPVEFARPTIRQRVENLLNRGIDPLAHYVGTEGIEMDVPDDPEAPVTPSEANYLDLMASQLAEAAPLPDEGLPRLVSPSPSQNPPAPPEAAPAGVASPPQAPAPAPTNSTVPSR